MNFVCNRKQLFTISQQLISIEVKDIAYFLAEGRMSYFLTWDKRKFVVAYTLAELERLLDPSLSFHANWPYLIHIKSIRKIRNYFNGKLKLELNPSSIQDDVVIS